MRHTNKDENNRGLTLRHTLRGHLGVIGQLGWSPDGKTLASPSTDGTIRFWDVATGLMTQQITWPIRGNSNLSHKITSVTWAPDGQHLASGSYAGEVGIWDVNTGELLKILKGHSYLSRSVSCSPDGKTLASGAHDRTIRLWRWQKEDTCKVLEGHSSYVCSVRWSPDGKTLASGSHDKTIRLWDINRSKPRAVFQGHTDTVLNLAWSPDGETLLSTSADHTIRLWDAATGSLKHVLEGHGDNVSSACFLANGLLLLSKSYDDTVRLWRCDTLETVAVLKEPASLDAFPSLDAPSDGTTMATLDEKDTAIRIWDLDLKALLGAQAAVSTVHYTTAKVVLVGETGVGKTGLGYRLCKRAWKPTDGSTHGMNVWQLPSSAGQEIMLWDFAGQPEYRLIHQLFLNDTNVALMLYDPTKSDDTFFSVEYWNKALTNAIGDGYVKFLVASRIDVGNVRMTPATIDAYCTTKGYAGHYATSAQTNEGCNELRRAIEKAIPWHQLPTTSSPEAIKRLKDFVGKLKQKDRVLIREQDLLIEFRAVLRNKRLTDEELQAGLGHIEKAGQIKRLSFGDFIVVKPELLNGLGSDIIDEARRHSAGLGCVRKSDVLDGRIPLKEVEGLSRSDQIFLLHATVELFLGLGLALEQDGNLVFPTKFNQQMPALEGDPIVDVEFSFTGPVDNLYTTLVVKLFYSRIFRQKNLWKNAAEFLNARDQVCGFQLRSQDDGEGTLKVFYTEGVSDDDKALFLKIIADHFSDKGVSVHRKRLYRCQSSECREAVRDELAVKRALERGRPDIHCQYCDEPIRLIDALEVLYSDDRKFVSQIIEMDREASANMQKSGALVSAEAEFKANFQAWAGGGDVATVALAFTDVLGSTELNVKWGNEPWKHVRESHFLRAKQLIKQGHGYLIKTIGDSVMAAFHSSIDAVDFALALERNTGHDLIKIRVGIHNGPVEVTETDAFGQDVARAARIEAHAEQGGIIVSDKVKEDLDAHRAARHASLIWKELPELEFKGFPNKHVLWSVALPESAGDV